MSKQIGELRGYGRIDVLANNAGGAQNERKLTGNGFESTFQINLLAGFLLTDLLLEKLCECRATEIRTSGIAANLFGAGLDVNDLQNEMQYRAARTARRTIRTTIIFSEI